MKRKQYHPQGINNFHNRGPISLMVPDQPVTDYPWEGPLYQISDRQRRRIERHFCGVADCRCPHGGVVEYYAGMYGVQAKWVD